MANLSDINSKISSLTGTDITSYPNANRAIDISLWQEKIIGMIFDSQDESDHDDNNRTDLPIITTPLEANKRVYTVPVSKNLLEWKSVSISYDGSNYVRANPVDVANITLGNEANIDSYFSKDAPGYSTKGLSLFIYPRASENTGEVLVEYSRAATAITEADLVTGTLIPGFDQTFHMMLAYGASYEYGLSNTLANFEQIKAELAEFEQRLRRQYGRKNRDRTLRAKSVYSMSDFS